MKKGLAFLLMILMVLTVFVSCDEAKHEHSYGTEWKYDENNHWHECECKEKKDVAAHKYGEWKASKEEGKVERTCSVCDYVEKADTVLVGTKGELTTAIAAGVKTIVLANDITNLNETLDIKKSLTLDMNGHSITATLAADSSITKETPVNIFYIEESGVTFEIKNSSKTESIIAGDAVGKKLPRSICINNGITDVKVIIGENVKSNTAEGILILSGTLDVYGKVYVTTRTFAISGNATKDWEAADPGTIINLYKGAEVKSLVVEGTSTGRVAIYHPQKGILNIKGATVEGYAGINIRSGELNISDGAIVKGIANDNVLTEGRQEGGAQYDGSAIVICSSTDSYHGNMKISITDSTIESTYSYAIREAYTSTNTTTKLVSLKIGGNSVLKAVSSSTTDLSLKDASKVEITGGAFSKDPSTYVKTGYKAEKSDDVWVVKADTTT